MRYHVLACDYDGTAASQGTLHQATIDALRRLRASGGRAVLVTGRELEDLCEICPETDSVFDFVVAENGAVLYEPATRSVRELGLPPSPLFVDALRKRDVFPLYIGRVIVATVEPHAPRVREVIDALGLPLSVILNKDAVMVLPNGIDKGSGIRAALAALGIRTSQAIGVGDAENDLPLLAACGLGVAVENALPVVKAAAALSIDAANGAGVRALIDRMIADDLD